MSESKLNLVLCWHMHQPWYRKTLQGDYLLPWVYLHALKDYSDMATHLEEHPGMRVVVNFTPVLLEQLDDYAKQCKNWLKNRTDFSDDMLNYLSGRKPIPSSHKKRLELVNACRRAHAPQMIDPYPAFKKLINDITHEDGSVDEQQIHYLNDQFFLDLLTWYHIAWMGFSVKRMRVIKQLMKKGSLFNEGDRLHLIQVISRVMGSLIKRYQKLADKGQVELSMTPYAHPIVPLLIDFEAQHESLPEAAAPKHPEYPGGLERARWHMQHGIEVFERYFKRRPEGVWLSEGGVSEAGVKLLQEFDIKWTASGEGVWHNSCYISGFDVHDSNARRSLFRCHELPDMPLSNDKPRMFFRDDGLSDLIGFEYQAWDALDAAGDFIKHMENISQYLQDAPGDHVVSVILDGENAWEYYPDNAYHFLKSLYTALEVEEHVRLQTFSEATKECPPHELPRLCAGSWVYGSFSTWIGDSDKNRGWDLLVEAKQAYDSHLHSLAEDEQKTATLQLAICEGSDWFWWFGDYNPSDSVSDFDVLYRQQLKNLYRMLKLDPPRSLDRPISEGHGYAENAGTMRRGHGH